MTTWPCLTVLIRINLNSYLSYIYKFFKYMICRFIFSQTLKPRPGVCPAIRKVSKDFCARAFVVSDCKGKDSDCPKGIPLQRTQRVFFYISHYSVTEINPFHDGSVAENTTEQVN